MKKNLHNQRKNYYRNYYLKRTIKNILSSNQDVFDEAGEIIINYDSGDIPFHFPEFVKTFPEYLIIRPEESSCKHLLPLINWENVGSVFIYKKGIPKEAHEILEGGKKLFMEFIKTTLTGKKELDPEWEFIYHMQPDIFLSRKANSVMIGSLTNYSLVNIRHNLPDTNDKPEING